MTAPPPARPSDAPQTRRWSLTGSARSRAAKAGRILTYVVVAVIAGNLLLNPLNPLTSSLYPALGKPFVTARSVQLAPLSDDGPLQQLVSTIPPRSYVTAPLPLYSWIASDPYAYPMIPGVDVNSLPGGPILPDYVLLPYNVPNSDWNSTLLGAIYDRSIFGVRGCVSNSSVGGVELFQHNYLGTPATFGPGNALCPNYFAGGSGLSPGPFSEILPNASSPAGVVVQSSPCASNGTLWTGPPLSLGAGQYKLQVVLSAMNSTDTACIVPSIDPTNPLLTLNLTAPGPSATGASEILDHNFRVDFLCRPGCGGWYFWNTTITVQEPESDITTTAVVEIDQYFVAVAYLLISPVPHAP